VFVAEHDNSDNIKMQEIQGDPFVGRKIMQPKKEIMSFLAGKGIRVPIIYDTIDDAIRDEKKDIMFRSEHPQDYEGCSDLFPNGGLEKNLLDAIDVTEVILSQGEYAAAQIKLHCELKGIDYDPFVGDLSHSAWERLIGTNRVAFADSAVKGRYHVITVNPQTSYDIIDGSEVRRMTDKSLDTISSEEASEIIGLYEQVRENMDPVHCYIVETQSVQNYSPLSKDHFAVQVHRGVDFQEADFKVERDYEAMQFQTVRGATSPEGEELLLTINYPGDFRFNPTIIEEGGSMTASEHDIPRVFSEIMFRKRGLQIFPYRDEGDLRYELGCHCSRNALFKPSCSILAYSPPLLEKLGDTLGSKELVQKNVHFVSDGRSASIKFLD
jgi:hypothetical protein